MDDPSQFDDDQKSTQDRISNDSALSLENTPCTRPAASLAVGPPPLKAPAVSAAIRTCKPMSPRAVTNGPSSASYSDFSLSSGGVSQQNSMQCSGVYHSAAVSHQASLQPGEMSGIFTGSASSEFYAFPPAGVGIPESLLNPPADLTELNRGINREPSFRYTGTIESRTVSRRSLMQKGQSAPIEVINDNYIVYNDVLGRGSYSEVRLCHSIRDGEWLAMKIINKNYLKKMGFGPDSAFEKVQREIAIMKTLKHDNIVELREVINDPEDTNIYLILELAEHREIMDVSNDGVMLPPEDDPPYLPEYEVRRITKRLVNALLFAHSHGIAHRDVKPQNILITATHEVKLSDFGVSIMVDDSKNTIVSREGSIAFLPPELLVPSSVHLSAKSPSGSQSHHHRRVLSNQFEPVVSVSPLCVGLSLAAPVSPVNNSSVSSDSFPSPNAAGAKEVDLFKADVWSCGVTIFALLIGRLPWRLDPAERRKNGGGGGVDVNAQRELILSNPDPFVLASQLNCVETGEMDLAASLPCVTVEATMVPSDDEDDEKVVFLRPSELVARTTDEAKDFVLRCLAVDPDTRPTMLALKDHPWLTASSPKSLSRSGAQPVHVDPTVAAASTGGGGAAAHDTPLHLKSPAPAALPPSAASMLAFSKCYSDSVLDRTAPVGDDLEASQSSMSLSTHDIRNAFTTQRRTCPVTALHSAAIPELPNWVRRLVSGKRASMSNKLAREEGPPVPSSLSSRQHRGLSPTSSHGSATPRFRLVVVDPLNGSGREQLSTSGRFSSGLESVVKVPPTEGSPSGLGSDDTGGRIAVDAQPSAESEDLIEFVDEDGETDDRRRHHFAVATPPPNLVPLPHQLATAMAAAGTMRNGSFRHYSYDDSVIHAVPQKDFSVDYSGSTPHGSSPRTVRRVSRRQPQRSEQPPASSGESSQQQGPQ